MTSEIVHKEVVISSGGTVSTASSYNDDRTGASTPQATSLTLVGFYTPAALTGTAMTFQAAPNASGTYVEVVDGATGSAYSVTVAASKYIALDPAKTYGINQVKLVSGSSEAADRTITLVYRRV